MENKKTLLLDLVLRHGNARLALTCAEALEEADALVTAYPRTYLKGLNPTTIGFHSLKLLATEQDPYSVRLDKSSLYRGLNFLQHFNPRYLTATLGDEKESKLPLHFYENVKELHLVSHNLEETDKFIEKFKNVNYLHIFDYSTTATSSLFAAQEKTWQIRVNGIAKKAMLPSDAETVMSRIRPLFSELDTDRVRTYTVTNAAPLSLEQSAILVRTLVELCQKTEKVATIQLPHQSKFDESLRRILKSYVWLTRDSWEEQELSISVSKPRIPRKFPVEVLPTGGTTRLTQL